MRTTDNGLPVARGEGLLIEQVDTETLVYDAESKEAHCLAPLAAAVFARCDGRTSVAEIAERAGEDLGTAVDVESVQGALAQLEERALLVRFDAGLSRRDMVRRTAKLTAAAAAVPLITSIVVPTPAAAVTCAPVACKNNGSPGPCTQTGCTCDQGSGNGNCIVG